LEKIKIFGGFIRHASFFYMKKFRFRGLCTYFGTKIVVLEKG
jgi:hypothetical protein